MAAASSCHQCSPATTWHVKHTSCSNRCTTSRPTCLGPSSSGMWSTTRCVHGLCALRLSPEVPAVASASVAAAPRPFPTYCRISSQRFQPIRQCPLNFCTIMPAGANAVWSCCQRLIEPGCVQAHHLPAQGEHPCTAAGQPQGRQTGAEGQDRAGDVGQHAAA